MRDKLSLSENQVKKYTKIEISLGDSSEGIVADFLWGGVSQREQWGSGLILHICSKSKKCLNKRQITVESCFI